MHAQPRKGSTNSPQYLQQMLGELRAIAEAERYAMLAYLIEMAYIEVSDIVGGKRHSRLHDEQRDGPAGVPLKTTRKV
jgi:hypothetical protein